MNNKTLLALASIGAVATLDKPFSVPVPNAVMRQKSRMASRRPKKGAAAKRRIQNRMARKSRALNRKK
jgi:hypothetical protein